VEIYLVGGAVRDRLLHIDNHDNDWVVVNSTPEIMLHNGFKSVGKDFPVFLHPETQEEYALARTEKKLGHGYTGFECYCSQDVTLEEDLLRRDLTINAMAQDSSGNIIDPYGGQGDLQNRTLRHVSDAFSDDPLRVLRIARFAAKLHQLKFTIADETMHLMRKIVLSGELSHLTAERVWLEWHKSLLTPSPDIFIQTLRQCGALAILLPEIDRLFGIPQPEKWHPEIDTGIHVLLVLKQISKLSNDPVIRFSATVHDVGKSKTPRSEWPCHKKHEHEGLSIIHNICDRFKLPNNYRELALIVCKYHTNIHKAFELKPGTLITLFSNIDVWRRKERLTGLLLCCQADYMGRKGCSEQIYPQKQFILNTFELASRVDVQDIIAQGYRGKDIKEQLDKKRADTIKNASY